MDKYIKNNTITIKKEKFQELYKKQGDRLFDDLNMLVNKGVIDYPFSFYFAKKLDVLYKNLLKYKKVINNEPYEILGKNSYDLKFNGKYLTICHPDKDYWNMDIITDYFTQDIRINCKGSGKVSQFQYWIKYNKDYFVYILDNNWDLNMKNLSEAGFGLNVKQCTTFKSSLVKAVIEILGSPKSVLDFSAGWGDRLIGCSASKVERYLGFDPNTDLKNGHTRIINTFAKGKDYKVIYKPFETAELNQKFDLVFTSPPYFDFEEYSEEKTQSMHKFNKYEKWLHNFLFVALDKSWDALNKNGHIAIHIQDTKTMPGVCDSMNNYLSKKKNSKYLGVIGSMGYSKIRRPIWIWKKV